MLKLRTCLQVLAISTVVTSEKPPACMEDFPISINLKKCSQCLNMQGLGSLRTQVEWWEEISDWQTLILFGGNDSSAIIPEDAFKNSPDLEVSILIDISTTFIKTNDKISYIHRPYSLKIETSFIALLWCLQPTVGFEEYSAHDWRAATSSQRVPVTWREWGLWLRQWNVKILF